MLEDMVMDIGINSLGVTILTTRRTTSDMIMAAFLTHPDVSDAFVVDISDTRNGTIFTAYITLKGKTRQYRELKLELGWHVVAEIGSCVKFRDIVIIDTNDNVVDDNRPLVMVPAQDSGSKHTHRPANRISAEEAEKALRTHPLVGDVWVAGIPDENTGIVLVAYVTLCSGVGDAEDIVSDLVWHVVSEVGSNVRFKNIIIVDSIGEIQEKIDQFGSNPHEFCYRHQKAGISIYGNDQQKRKVKEFIQPFYWW